MDDEQSPNVATMDHQQVLFSLGCGGSPPVDARQAINSPSPADVSGQQDESPSQSRRQTPSPKEAEQTFGQQLKDIGQQVTFLTHQVVQLMHVLCIAHCRCPLCVAFVSAAQLPQNLLPHSFAPVENGSTLQERNSTVGVAASVDEDDIVIDELATTAATTVQNVKEKPHITDDDEDEEEDDDDDLSVLSTGNFVNDDHKDVVSREMLQNDSQSLLQHNTTIPHNDNNMRHSTGHYSSDSSLSNGVLVEENFAPNGYRVPLLSNNRRQHHFFNGFHTTAAAVAYRNGGRRHIVGVDQLLPKLLAEQSDTRPVDGDSSPQAENLTCDGENGRRRRLSSASAAVADCKTVDLTTTDTTDNRPVRDGVPLSDPSSGFVDGNFLGAVNLIKPAAAEQRALMRKRRRLLENIDYQNHTALSINDHVPSITQPPVDRPFFPNGNSPCSSGGSLELPKAAVESIANGDHLLCNIKPGASADSMLHHHLETSHDREPRFSYLSALAPAMSAGLPLVMPGPKATTFYCTICNREFSNVYYKRHMIVHANSRPYVCDVCGKRFNERSNMMKHKQRLHVI